MFPSVFRMYGFYLGLTAMVGDLEAADEAT